MSTLPSLTALERSANTDRFCYLLRETKREGIENLITHLSDKTDFFSAPASSKYHSNITGGLCAHSLNVFDCLETVTKRSPNPPNSESIILSALLHDVCKANYYAEAMKWRKDKNDKWEQYAIWITEEQFPFGHGEKSALIANKFITMTSEELLAIRWHMGPWDQDVHHEDSTAFNLSREKYPLVRLLYIADELACVSEVINVI